MSISSRYSNISIHNDLVGLIVSFKVMHTLTTVNDESRIRLEIDLFAYAMDQILVPNH